MSRELWYAFLVGTGALLGSVIIIGGIAPMMGQPAQSSMYVCSVIGSYSIGSPVTWYCLRQNRRLREALVELEQMHAELSRRSRIDVMTGVLNREAFMAAARQQLAEDAGSVLLILDIDNFKHINDTWGHLAGDRAIELVAAAIRDTAVPDAKVGRIGGEEFAIISASGTSQAHARQADALRTAVEDIAFHPVEGMRQALTVSIGGCAGHDGAILTDVVRLADRCLYRAKDSGRNRVVIQQAA
jgi:diguanylate cyclase (GGDEF)-like protein